MISTQTSSSTPLSPEPDGLLLACDAIGNIIEFWGFRRILGRIWTLLYLSPQALSAQEIGDQLGLSAGSVSMSLHEMESWGLLIRERYTGHRGAVFRAETHVWKLVSRVICNRELHQLANLRQGLEASLEKYKQVRGSPKNTMAIHRLERLLSIVCIGHEVFELTFGAGSHSWDLKSLERLSRLRQLFQKN